MDSVRADSVAAPLDVDALVARCLGHLDLAERILAKFQTTLDSDLNELEQAVVAGNIQQVAYVAHRIKGASLAVSAGPITECARRLEAFATARRPDDLPQALRDLKLESSRCQALTGLPTPTRPVTVTASQPFLGN